MMLENLRAVSNRVHLRHLQSEDAAGPYHDWINDPEVTRFLVTRLDYQSVEAIEGYIQEMNARRDEIMLAVCDNETDRHIGKVKLQQIDPVHQTAWLSIVIGPTGSWGKGIGTETIALMTGVGFDDIDLRRIDASCFAENIGVQRAFEKCGYQHEGRTREQYFAEGRSWDAVRLGILRDDPPLWREFLS